MPLAAPPFSRTGVSTAEAILALGRQDVAVDSLLPPPGTEILGQQRPAPGCQQISRALGCGRLPYLYQSTGRYWLHDLGLCKKEYR